LQSFTKAPRCSKLLDAYPKNALMARKDPLHDIELLLRSRHGLIIIDTVEEERASLLLNHLSDHMQLPLFVWNRTRGLRRIGLDTAVYGTTDPAQALAHIAASPIPAVYHMQSFASLLADEAHQERVKEIAQQFGTRAGAIVFTGEALVLPDTLRRLASHVSLPKPDIEEYQKLLEQILRDLSMRMRVRTQMTKQDGIRLLNHLKGLTLLEAEKVLTKAIVEDGLLSPEDISHVITAKKEIVERDGVLEYYPLEESLSEVADLAGLKGWLAKRKNIITDRVGATEFGLTFPKGVLLVGVPGCGKSLCAKAVAMEWGLPLLKLDPGALYNKYIGETEKNFKRAMTTAERIAPVVLWIDELEKAFASGGDEDGGVSQRVLGTFLSWMQDRSGDVFIVATANDVTRLPPEFLRKGRFDEVFFVDLPTAESRRAILEIHLRKRGKDPTAFDLVQVVDATPQFSGAELEQIVVAALYTVFAARAELTTDALMAEVQATRPLAHTMAERITWLRDWARERTVSAN
jgi:SpoVK/Ycf46/Vps4 family AAA+-type ATPase